MSVQPTILEVGPTVGLPGGEIIITCRDFDTSRFGECRVYFGSTRGRIVSASDRRVVAAVPEMKEADTRTEIRLAVGNAESNPFPFHVGTLLADNLHPVCNPAYDADSGTIYTTLSGTRGKKVEVSVWRITAGGEVQKYLTDLVNPTGLAFDAEGTLFITSRYEGTVYRISPFKEVESFADDLGVATGIAFDRHGRMFVGDRQGTIFAVDSLGKVKPFAELDPSVSAYHLAFAPGGDLFVTAPTAAGSRESVFRIDAEGTVSKFFTGFGRPQGLAFDTDGNLYVAASFNGRRGLWKLSPSGEKPTMVLAHNQLIGIAFDDSGNVIAATTREIYRAPLGVKGYMASLGE